MSLFPDIGNPAMREVGYPWYLVPKGWVFTDFSDVSPLQSLTRPQAGWCFKFGEVDCSRLLQLSPEPLSHSIGARLTSHSGPRYWLRVKSAGIYYWREFLSWPGLLGGLSHLVVLYWSLRSTSPAHCKALYTVVNLTSPPTIITQDKTNVSPMKNYIDNMPVVLGIKIKKDK